HALDKQPAAFVLMQTVLNLANSLGLHSVVEGVETQKQLEMVTSMGADCAQGFLLSHPLSLEQLVALNAASDIIAGSKDGRVDALAVALGRKPTGLSHSEPSASV
ncbi:MAG: EAL domain-containing protein, partial [Pseudomonadota bacterium]